MGDASIQETGRKLSPLEVVQQALREEEEKKLGIWTKLYKGLSEADRKNLLDSTSLLINEFVNQYPNELPDIIVLPEISARPLFYLLNPIMKALAEKRQVKMPRFVYFQTHKGPELTLIDEEGQEKVTTPLKDLRKLIDSVGTDSFLHDYLQSELEVRQGGPEKARKMRNFMKNRAQEIRKYTETSGTPNPKMVIFDDYVTRKHSSIDEIRLAFGENIPAYCLLQERDVVFSHGVQIFTGIDDPYGTREIANSQGFEYRSEHEGNRHAIGVDKDQNNKYVKSSMAKNTVSMQNLRKGLGEIGSQIAQMVA